MYQTPLVGIESVDHIDQFRIVEAVITEQMSDMCPVFLFDMGVVVFLVWSWPGELDSWFMLGEVSQQMVIKELGAIAAVEAF